MPASLIYNWRNELEKFAPNLTVQTITGTPSEREEKLKRTADVWITSYPTLRQDIDLYQHLHFHALILDEAQSIKNHTTKTAVAVRTISAKNVLRLAVRLLKTHLMSFGQFSRPFFLAYFQGFASLKHVIGAGQPNCKTILLRRVKRMC